MIRNGISKMDKSDEADITTATPATVAPDDPTVETAQMKAPPDDHDWMEMQVCRAPAPRRD